MNLRLCKTTVTLILIASFIILSGCASIVSKSSYPISVNSTPSGAKITVTDKKGVDIYSAITPANFYLKSGDGYFVKARYTVTFELDGFDKKVIPVEFKLDGWFFGNIVFGGLIGMLIVDPATGAMWKLETKFLDETLSRSTVKTDEPALRIIGYNEVPESWKEKLVRIN